MNLAEQFEQAWKDAQEVKSSEAKPSETRDYPWVVFMIAILFLNSS